MGCCRDKFLAALMRALSLPAADPEDIQVRCLKAVLGEKSKDPTLHDQVPFLVPSHFLILFCS